MNKLFILMCVITQLHASIFDWFKPLSEKANRAQVKMEGFDVVVEKALKDYQIPGVAIGVIVDGHVIYAKGFGFRNIEKKLPVTNDTIFPVGSFTKAFTAFSIATLVEEGLLHWDERVVDITPDFRLFDSYATQNLTIRDLLTHRSGMPRHGFMCYNSDMTRAEVMRRLRYLEPSCNLRERYQYNDLMYVAAGCSVEALTGMDWEEFVQERILHRLDMKNTNFSIQEMQKSNDFAQPYLEKNGKWEKMEFLDLSLIGPAASMNSTLHDLTHWVQMQLNGGTYKGVSMINSALLQEMHTPQVVVPGPPEIKEAMIYAYGMGWGIASYRGQYFLSHDGISDGFTSTIGLLPHQGVGIVILCNHNLCSFPRFLSLQLIDRILELPYINWLKEGLDGVQKNQPHIVNETMKEDLLRKKGTTPSHFLEEFVGCYEHPGYGEIKVKLEDGSLATVYNGITSILDHWHYDVFNVIEEKPFTLFSRKGSKVTFQTNIKGDIDELSIPFEPNVKDIIFKRKKEDKHALASYFHRFIGLYDIYGYTVEITIRNHVLCAIIPGQPVYELVCGAENEFTVKSMNGFNLRFVMNDEGKVEEALLVQPYGAFTAKPRR